MRKWWPSCGALPVGRPRSAGGIDTTGALAALHLLEGPAMLPFRTILFATDFSPASNVAFNVAAALARDYRARIIALHVIEPVHMGFSEFGGYIGPDEDRDEAMKMLNAITPPAPTIALER